ncbi:LacI family DNA-binding transcriptional regulator [Siminovitchia sp. 179-K 8D1 HS]|uniref:LacI family DNA-binding transcriptional regulator n=1 Tax=Siminovitchia sp. 179-K 8D1 HS TaxID=3142385 RepID=UPI0039A32AF0
MSITIKDIATLAGVSYSTVSKALNNSPLVKSETKEKIIKIAEELGYEPNFAAQRLVSKHSKTIGVIWPTVERMAPSSLVTKINEIVKKNNYQMLLSIDTIKNSLETFKKFQVDGVIVFDEQEDEPIAALAKGLPVVSYGVGQDEDEYPIIDVNYQGAMKTAVNYLHQLGHKHIAFVGDFSPIDNRQFEKYKGFLKAMEELGLPVTRNHLINTAGLEWLDGYSAVNRMLQSAAPVPTAIIGASYDISSGIVRALREADFTIPKDISVIGYDNIPQMANLEVPLTSVGVPVQSIADRLVHTLIDCIHGQYKPEQDGPLKPVLTERNSCAQARKIQGV